MQDKTTNVLRPRSSPQRRGLFFYLTTAIRRRESAKKRSNLMAKGQKRSNREAKKPKQVKNPVEATPSTNLTKGMASMSRPSKKK